MVSNISMNSNKVGVEVGVGVGIDVEVVEVQVELGVEFAVGVVTGIGGEDILSSKKFLVTEMQSEREKESLKPTDIEIEVETKTKMIDSTAFKIDEIVDQLQTRDPTHSILPVHLFSAHSQPLQQS